MASTTTPTAPFRGGTLPPLRQLWQVPAFLLGVAALAAVCAARPLWHDVGSCAEPEALAELRDLLKQPDFDADRALKLGAEAVQDAGTPSARASAHFLLGSAYVALAERPGPTGTSEHYWREARGHLEQAQTLGVLDEDGPRLGYRLAKAWAHTGEPPSKVIDALSRLTEDGADDPRDMARGYDLLAENYLKLSPPDPEAALAATVKEIDLPNVDADLLAPARLRRGGLLLRLDRAEEAREVLKNIQSPPDIVAPARRLLVGSLEQDRQWGEAAGVWRDIRDDAKVPPRDRAAVLYHLGLCLRNAGGHPDEAVAAWKACLALDGAGDEAPAAALGLAELDVQAGRFDEAAAAFERAVRDVKEGDEWRNKLEPLPPARAAFEAGCKAARAAGAFQASAHLAQLYGRLAAPGRAQELRAGAIDALGRAALERARQAPAEQAQPLYGEADALLCQAGEAYEQAAAAQADPAEEAERRWLAGNAFLEGHRPARAAAAFERFVTIAWPATRMPPDRRFMPRLNEACYKLAVARRDGSLPGAAEAFESAVTRLEIDSPYVYRARYELAMTGHVLDPATGTWSWTDDAKERLEQNLSQLRVSTVHDAEAREKTLYALGELYFDRSDQRGTASRGADTRALVSKAIETLEDALREFPNNPQALRARYELAESYRLRADYLSASFSQEQLTVEARLLLEKKVRDDHEKAVVHYQELSRQLEARPSRTPEEDVLLAYALRMAAQVRYLAGDYERAAAMFEALAERHRGQKAQAVEYCTALAWTLRAYWTAATYPAADGERDEKVRALRQKAQQALRDIRAALPALDPRERQSFEDYLKLFEQPAATAGPVTPGSSGK